MKVIAKFLEYIRTPLTVRMHVLNDYIFPRRLRTPHTHKYQVFCGLRVFIKTTSVDRLQLKAPLCPFIRFHLNSQRCYTVQYHQEFTGFTIIRLEPMLNYENAIRLYIYSST